MQIQTRRRASCGEQIRKARRRSTGGLSANQVIQEQIQPLLERPTEWPSREPIVSYHDFAYQAQSWHLPRRVVAKVEWHQGELFPRVGFIVTNLSYPPKGIVRSYFRMR